MDSIIQIIIFAVITIFVLYLLSELLSKIILGKVTVAAKVALTLILYIIGGLIGIALAVIRGENLPSILAYFLFWPRMLLHTLLGFI